MTAPVDRLRELLATDAAAFEERVAAEAVHGAQREYVRRQERTLFEGSFLEWR